MNYTARGKGGSLGLTFLDDVSRPSASALRLLTIPFVWAPSDPPDQNHAVAANAKAAAVGATVTACSALVQKEGSVNLLLWLDALPLLPDEEIPLSLRASNAPSRGRMKWLRPLCYLAPEQTILRLASRASE